MLFKIFNEIFFFCGLCCLKRILEISKKHSSVRYNFEPMREHKTFSL